MRRLLGVGVRIVDVHGGQQAFAERGLFAAACGAVPRVGRLECRPRSRVLSERAQHAPEVHAGERGEANVTGGFGLVDRELEGGGAGVVVAGLALRASEAGELVRLGLLEPETPRRLRGATHVADGVVEAVLDAGQLAADGFAADVEPRVVDVLQPAFDVIDGVDAARLVAGGDRGSGGEEPVGGLVPRPVEPVVERVAAIGQLERVAELAVMRHDVGEVVRAARLQVDIVDRVGQLGGFGDVVAGQLEAIGRRFDPRGEQQGVGPVVGPGRRRRPRRVRPGSVARLGCRRGRPRPSRTR